MEQNVNEKVCDSIKSLYRENDGARKFLDWAASLQRSAVETTIEYIMQRANINYNEAQELGKKLHEAGCGQYLVGRRGWKTRVRWFYALKSLGRAAKDEGFLEPVPINMAEITAVEGVSGISLGGTDVLTIAEAKRKLALSLGVSPDVIDITIRA